MLSTLKKILPSWIADGVRPAYHYTLQFGAALLSGSPASKLIVIGVTGTKGKSTVCDMLYHVLSSTGHPTALASTIRFVTPKGEEPNKFKMTMQGRGFIQRFLARARRAGARYAVVEITSEGVLQSRHKFLELDALIVTNIQKEHIERHGSFENYVAAKQQIVRELELSKKKNKILVSNTLTSPLIPAVAFALEDAPTVPVPGEFNRMNAAAARVVAEHLGISRADADQALATLPPVRGRVERIDEGQDFITIVDYAHTPDSLKALYDAFPNHKKICVLGNTGGGRDTWKRGEMGAIADQACETVILTNEDPYDEDPRAIVDAMAAAMKRAPTIIMDRREAIRTALGMAETGDAVLVSGKGTDPFIMEAGGKRTPWSDAQVVREELKRLVH